MPKNLERELQRAARTNHADDALKAMERYLDARAHDNLPEARKQLLRAKEAAPRSTSVREALGRLAADQGEWHEAVQELLAHRRLTGEQHNVPVIAECYMKLGRPERALELIAEPMKVAPTKKTSAELRAVRARALAVTGRATEALDFLAFEILRERDAPAKARLEQARAQLASEQTQP